MNPRSIVHRIALVALAAAACLPLAGCLSSAQLLPPRNERAASLLTRLVPLSGGVIALRGEGRSHDDELLDILRRSGAFLEVRREWGDETAGYWAEPVSEPLRPMPSAELDAARERQWVLTLYRERIRGSAEPRSMLPTGPFFTMGIIPYFHSLDGGYAYRLERLGGSASEGRIVSAPGGGDTVTGLLAYLYALSPDWAVEPLQSEDDRRLADLLLVALVDAGVARVLPEEQP